MEKRKKALWEPRKKKDLRRRGWSAMVNVANKTGTESRPWIWKPRGFDGLDKNSSKDGRMGTGYEIGDVGGSMEMHVERSDENPSWSRGRRARAGVAEKGLS